MRIQANLDQRAALPRPTMTIRRNGDVHNGPIDEFIIDIAVQNWIAQVQGVGIETHDRSCQQETTRWLRYPFSAEVSSLHWPRRD